MGAPAAFTQARASPSRAKSAENNDGAKIAIRKLWDRFGKLSSQRFAPGEMHLIQVTTPSSFWAMPASKLGFDIPDHVDYRRQTMNKFLRAWVVALVGVTCILSGCSRFAGVNSKSAVQAAIEAHLKKQPGLTLSNMTTEIKDVKFEGDKATAQ